MPARFSFDRIADEYEETRRLPPVVLDGLAEQMVEAFERGRVLDAGVGTGRYAAALEVRGLQVVGVDVARRMLEKARARRLSQLLQGDVGRLPFRDQAFDHSVAVAVLHILPNWREGLRELARVTRGHLATVNTTHTETAVGQVYVDALRECGWERSSWPPGVEILDLVGRVPPAMRFARITVREEARTDDIIDMFAKKSFTWQWDLSDEFHRRALGRMEGHRGQSLTMERTWELIVWRVQDFAGL
ncbi:MAG: class I SAM-dependent methyltransferase [Euryarchaeota archaeon]|nr:class I SAM-dependent methyltransferase [Euryarchaeota archaeon]